jgi:hypothetical protein
MNRTWSPNDWEEPTALWEGSAETRRAAAIDSEELAEAIAFAQALAESTRPLFAKRAKPPRRRYDAMNCRLWRFAIIVSTIAMIVGALTGFAQRCWRSAPRSITHAAIHTAL